MYLLSAKLTSPVFILAPYIRGGDRYSRGTNKSRPEGPKAGVGFFGRGS